MSPLLPRAVSLGLLSLTLLVSPALAGPTQGVTRVFTDTASSETRTLTFFRGLASLEDGDVAGEDLQRAIRKSGLKPEGLLGAFVSGMTRIKKRGDRVTIYQAAEVVADTGNGAVKVAKKMEFRVRARGARGVKLDKMSGAEASKAGGSFYPLRWLELSADADGITSARLNAGYGIFSKTVSMVLKRPEPAAETDADDDADDDDDDDDDEPGSTLKRGIADRLGG